MKAIIIGAGYIAGVHCRALQHLQVEIAAICDSYLPAAEKLAQSCGAKVYTDVEAALQENADFVAVCTPNGTHAALAIQAMKAGKNVVVEKPLALTAEDCDAVLQTARETGKLCAPISQLRFSSMYLKVKQLLEQGGLGQLIMATLSMKFYRSPDYYKGSWKGTKALDGGQLMNQGIHGIDLMCGLLGTPVSVSGTSRTLYQDIEAEDTSVAQFTFANGMVGVLDSSVAIQQSKPRRTEICGTTGFLEITEGNITRADGVDIPCDGENTLNTSADPQAMGDNLHILIYENILSAMEKGTPLAYTAEDAANTVRFICAIYKSSETNSIVTI